MLTSHVPRRSAISQTPCAHAMVSYTHALTLIALALRTYNGEVYEIYPGKFPLECGVILCVCSLPVISKYCVLKIPLHSVSR